MVRDVANSIFYFVGVTFHQHLIHRLDWNSARHEVIELHVQVRDVLVESRVRQLVVALREDPAAVLQMASEFNVVLTLTARLVEVGQS